MSAHPVAVIGGTGLYDLEGIEQLSEKTVDTPFGTPSDSIVSGVIHDTEVFFLPRHGRGHRLLPSEVNYRANIYALKSLGAKWCISVSAVGSLAEEITPGHIVIPDQLIDRTRGRANTFFGDGVVAHVAFAEPYCPTLREVLFECCTELGLTVHNGSTFVCMEGPAFSTRAESHLYRSWGARIIGMTNLPEAKLAREAELAYATVALATDYDCWKEDEKDVEVTDVLETLQRNAENAKQVVSAAIKSLGTKEPSALCADALQNAILSDLSAMPSATKERLEAIVGRYCDA